jgi:F0F1-type ATP synthase membrane subunit b/b'
MSDEVTHRPLADTDTLLRRVIAIVRQARPMPLSASVIISREEVLELLDEAVEQLPEELREARWLLKEREEFLERARAEGEEIIAQASLRAEQMVQRQEVTRAAEARARQIVTDAEAQARQMRHEVEDFCDQRLASFEITLDKVRKAVDEGRARLRPPLPEPPPAVVEEEPAEPESTFFDQDVE